jgi:Protein of unknown function (DUF3800)
MAASVATAPLVVEVYIDESSTQHRYLVLGAVVTPSANVDGFVRMLWNARLPDLPREEMKWVKVSRTKLPAYIRFVDFFFDQVRGSIDFHSLVIDTTRQQHRIYNQGNREIGFNKEVYQLAMKCARLYNALFHIYPDRRETNQRPEDLRLMLNRGIRRKGDKRDWPFRRVQFRDSKKTLLLQLSDLLAGALAYRLNEHDIADGASPAKIELSNHIRQRAGITNVFRDTPIPGKFTIWHRQLR